MKIVTISVCLGLVSLISVTPAFAHVIVTPKQIGVATTQTFTVEVPTEKNIPTTKLRLVIPSGITEVIPNVKQGWSIDVKKNNDQAIEIDWTGGSIPPEQRDEFEFQAQAPAKETTVKWLAYQTFQDGSTTEWIHNPTKNPEDDSAPPPYSTTMVVNDLKTTPEQQRSSGIETSMILSVAAIAISCLAFGLQIRKKRQN